MENIDKIAEELKENDEKKEEFKNLMFLKLGDTFFRKAPGRKSNIEYKKLIINNY